MGSRAVPWLSPLACLALLYPNLGARPVLAQEVPAAGAVGPVSVDSANKLRAALIRPPPEQPDDAVDWIEFPFRVVLFPVALFGRGVAEIMNLSIRPPEAGGLLAAYRAVVDWGLRPAGGGLGPRSGLGFGLRLDRFNPLFAEAALSFRGWQLYRGGVAGNWDRARAEASVGWYRQNALLFWGIGPTSPESSESEFRWDETSVGASGTARFTRHVSATLGGGYDRNDVTFRQGVFDTAAVFGTGVTNFWQVNGEAVLNLTHLHKLQTRGFRASGGGAAFFGSSGTSTDFWRLFGELNGYLPVNDRQQLALRGVVEINRGNEAGDIPFMYLATLGGTDILRSYNTDRFRDRDRLALTAEWRYEIWRDLHERGRVEGFVFWDEGTVARTLSSIDEFRTSAGVGMRFLFNYRLRAITFLAFGAEGARFTFTFSPLAF